ncbi:TorD/DmsD family molecular chaperone [Sulfurovum sp. ST-21]|uniref:Molecular chaperone TorD family protein n=1 Tax=Sulfurovum indicum TaxID=2779528 RepID=A0A7M1S211_9BACT|nr:molecular chaperone TorD family protein [Sulfurovum indicum]QOR61264.1 molecular chaperone TorD family protein [Sulfurovum indicum]
MNKRELNPARALYYGLFSKLFVFTTNENRYEGLDEILKILIENPMDNNSGEALKEILDFYNTGGEEAFIKEYDVIFNDPVGDVVRTTASIYCDGVESGKKTLEVRNFLAKTKIRRNEATFKEPEDSVGFLMTFMYELIELIIMGEESYSTVQHCLYVEVINEFIDEFIEDLYATEHSNIYKSVAVVLNAFIAFERLYFDVKKPQPRVKEEAISCESVSDEEAERRMRNRIEKSVASLQQSCALEDEYFEKYHTD